jgi:DNA-directed RNA polymerase subunit RPC12/RpoP
MARGEAYVRCPHCGFQSRIPVMALQRDNYHCSQCGHRIPLVNVNLPGEIQGQQPFRSRTKSQFQKRKRR